MASTSSGARVLSVQSHVVHGYVGNKSAVFPLQLLGFEVDSINTVHFSNHTGYPTFKGTVLSGQELLGVMEGLKSNDLVDHTHLLTGYIGSESVLDAVVDVLGELRAKNPGAVYVCDPVLGDHGRIYTKPELVDIYIEKVVPLADILTPNQFELQLLTGTKVETEEDIKRAVDLLHGKGPETVVVTSIYPEGQDSEAIEIIASTTREQCAGSHSRFKLRIPKLGSHFTGTGDLTAALLLAWCHEYPENLQQAVLRCMSTVYDVLKDTAANGRGNEKAFMKTPELRLIQNQDVIRKPPTHFASSVEPL
ncbi:pyridoxal kinase [Chloropicon primus]|uniref:pyridoxal kinase n=1 Tax=Chloropicon primus TaxID=1764295 RepID=A0A5B8MGF8_9CHLO|nr:pyridoxal kinase [Chloropicon primus]UPQ98687.1 pyridoxal kinase [Chloropicon primus]|eukprot:QDZ19477.1 pyridoxal kinase [Chloropicon primus]